MGVVGQFPGFKELNRRTIRGPVNPLDKSTIVSILPKEVIERKITIQPGVFIIPPGTFDKPAVLIVGPSSWWREFDDEQPLLEIPHSSIQVADSVVKDYCNGVHCCDMAGAMPGLFYVPGCKQDKADQPLIPETIAWIKSEYKTALETANMRQKRWFEELIKQADSLWARSNGNPLAISDDMRMAARESNLQDKDWMKNFQFVNMVRCFACGALKNPLYPVCASCRAIDPNNPLAKDVKFA